MIKKLKSSTQYYPDLERTVFDLELHSQMGEGYTLANLGNLDEAYDRLAKYDIEDQPLNVDRANIAISEFMDKIPNLDTLSLEGALDAMDMSKSIGYGASKLKIKSRRDPLMLKYFQDYINLVKNRIHNVIINASQKDEVRVINKTARLFMSFPPEHTLIATMVLGPFMDAWIENSFCSNGGISTVGDAVQNGAAKYYEEELSKFPYLYCTDTSGQDASVHPEFINMVYDAIKVKLDLDDEEEMLFEAVRHNSINKLVNMNGDLYMVPRGLGSGDYLTIVINIIWRYYLFLDSYTHDIATVKEDNKIAICGDDFISSSKYSDINHNSRHAKIEWAGKPVTWDDMDFCSLKFRPYIHHDELKVLSVLNLRKKRIHMMSPQLEMQRLGGILRVLSTREVYNEILLRMDALLEKYPEVYRDYEAMYISFDDIFHNYNSYFDFN